MNNKIMEGVCCCLRTKKDYTHFEDCVNCPYSKYKKNCKYHLMTEMEDYINELERENKELNELNRDSINYFNKMFTIREREKNKKLKKYLISFTIDDTEYRSSDIRTATYEGFSPEDAIQKAKSGSYYHIKIISVSEM